MSPHMHALISLFIPFICGKKMVAWLGKSETVPYDNRPMPIIEVENLSKSYRTQKRLPGLGGAVKGLFNRQYTEVRAVDGVSFNIEEGELVGFLGRNGAGKTTTLK